MALQNINDDDFKWRCVQARAPSTAFVYAVKTTKIFCRPECPARLARRANVTFFNHGIEAQTAGFRACKRCKPELNPCKVPAASKPTVIGKDTSAYVSTEAEELADLAPGEQNARKRAAIKAKRVLQSSQGRKSWKQVAQEVGLSPRYLFEAFKAIEGVTPGVYAERLRSSRKIVGTADATSSRGEETVIAPAASSSGAFEWSQFDSHWADFTAEDLDAYMISNGLDLGDGLSDGQDQLAWTPAETSWDSLSSGTTAHTPEQDHFDTYFAEPVGALSWSSEYQKPSDDMMATFVHEGNWTNEALDSGNKFVESL